jgi:hypothetical protein
LIEEHSDPASQAELQDIRLTANSQRVSERLLVSPSRSAAAVVFNAVSVDVCGCTARRLSRVVSSQPGLARNARRMPRTTKPGGVMTESRRHSPVSAAETEPGPMLLKIPPENWRRSWLGPAALAATTETRVGGCPLAGPSRRRLWHRRPNAELSQSMTTTFNWRSRRPSAFMAQRRDASCWSTS